MDGDVFAAVPTHSPFIVDERTFIDDGCTFIVGGRPFTDDEYRIAKNVVENVGYKVWLFRP
ncbi:MAG: hypothetical protein K2H79_04295 [Bacteroidaceae bacterium]|nr:hypothetical protein [Bacteroidaceae bacterium]